jgi:hypothetical protein
MIHEVGIRIAERREFPVEDRHHLEPVTTHDQVIEAVIAVHERRAGGWGHVVRKPGDQPIHLRDRLGLAQPILLRPALHLPGDVALGSPEIRKPDGGRIEGVQPGDGRVHGVVDGARSSALRAGHRRIPEHAPPGHAP